MTRPTVSGFTEVTANNTSVTAPATARGVRVWCFGNNAPGTNFTHAMTAITLGGISLTALDQNRSASQSHVCGFYLHDYAQFRSRSSDTFSFTGGTMGTAQNQYRARVCWILHATHTVVQGTSAGNSNSSQGNGTSLTCTPNPGTGIDAVTIIACRGNNTATANYGSNAGQTRQVGQAANSGSNIIETENITGSATEGIQNNTGANSQMAIAADAWREGTPLAKGRPKAWVIAALPLVTRALPMGLEYAAALPAA